MINNDMDKLRHFLKESYQLPSPLTIDEGCNYGENHWKYVKEFLEFCKTNLGLPNIPNINIADNRNNGMTTGAYEPSTDRISVYGKGRALVDVLRTIAHELTHYRQRLNDQIKSMDRDWNLEGEADAEAGKMVYTFAHQDPNYMQIYEL